MNLQGRSIIPVFGFLLAQPANLGDVAFASDTLSR